MTTDVRTRLARALGKIGASRVEYDEDDSVSFTLSIPRAYETRQCEVRMPTPAGGLGKLARFVHELYVAHAAGAIDIEQWLYPFMVSRSTGKTVYELRDGNVDVLITSKSTKRVKRTRK